MILSLYDFILESFVELNLKIGKVEFKMILMFETYLNLKESIGLFFVVNFSSSSSENSKVFQSTSFSRATKLLQIHKMFQFYRHTKQLP